LLAASTSLKLVGDGDPNSRLRSTHLSVELDAEIPARRTFPELSRRASTRLRDSGPRWQYCGTVLRDQRRRIVLGGVLSISTIFAAPFISAASASTSAPLQAQEIDLVGPTGLIVANLQGVFRTVDSGRHWTNITPPVIASQRILLSHINKIVSLGINRIWLELEGDTRIEFTPYSSNGGSSWHSLKTTAVVTYPIVKWNTTGLNPKARVPKGLHILHWFLASPSLGWARAKGPRTGAFTPTYLLRSTDDGKTWTTIATPQ
jgi:hypothetical protein